MEFKEPSFLGSWNELWNKQTHEKLGTVCWNIYIVFIDFHSDNEPRYIERGFCDT